MSRSYPLIINSCNEHLFQGGGMASWWRWFGVVCSRRTYWKTRRRQPAQHHSPVRGLYELHIGWGLERASRPQPARGNSKDARDLWSWHYSYIHGMSCTSICCAMVIQCIYRYKYYIFLVLVDNDPMILYSWCSRTCCILTYELLIQNKTTKLWLGLYGGSRPHNVSVRRMHNRFSCTSFWILKFAVLYKTPTSVQPPLCVSLLPSPR